GARSSPDPQCSGGLGISRSLCVEFACSPSVHKNSNRKTCKKEQFPLLSVRDRGGHFSWSPGAEKLPTAPGGSWGKDLPGWDKCRRKIHGNLGLCVSCVAT